MNPYSKLVEEVKNESDFLDLTNTNFTTLNPLIAYKDLETDLIKYFKNRKYEPDPKGLLTARQAVSDYYNQKGYYIDPKNILITASTSESYSLIFSAILKQGDRILLPNPSYPLFSYIASYTRTLPLYYNLNINAKGWNIDIESIRENIAKVKVLVLISPNNPTGMMISKKTIREIIDLIKGKDVILILDEVFNEFIYEDNDHFLIINELLEAEKVIVLNGISKSLASPDLKLAWMALLKGNPEMLDDLETANDTYLNCSYLTQSLLPSLIKSGEKNRAIWLDLLNRNRKILKAIANDKIQIILPQGGIHCIVNFPALTWENEKIALELLKNYHLAIHPGYFYDLPANSQQVVISLISKSENFKNALSRLHDFSIKYS